MYATIISGSVVYLGDCKDEAYKAGGDSLDFTTTQVNSLEELAAAMKSKSVTETVAEELSAAFEKIVGKLNECGVNKDLADKLKTNSEKLVGEAKSLGVRGMKAVGAGFIALGDLLNRAGAKEEEEVEDRACSRHDCCGH